MSAYTVYESLTTRKRITVNGRAVKNQWGLALIIARNPDKLWCVYETTSGAPIARHRLQKEAVALAIRLIEQHGIQQTLCLITKTIATMPLEA